MALYIPQSILHLARSLYVRPETYGPTYVPSVEHNYISLSSTVGIQLHVSALYAGHLQVAI